MIGRYSGLFQVLQGQLCNQHELYETLKGFDLSDKRFLDVGCGGTDGMQKYVEEQRGIYVGIDINLPEDKPPHKFIGDMHSLNFAERTFDFVLSSNTLEHAISPMIAMFEMARVLKDEGIILVGLPVGSGFDSDKEHFFNLTEPQMKNITQKAGLIIEDTKKIGNMKYYTIKWRK